MDHRKLIDEHIKTLEDAIHFYSNERKDERELWVVNAFLENLQISFSEEELIAVKDDPPDISFRDCRFEVKELMDEERKRTDEYKEQLEVAKKATRVDEILKPYRPRDTSLREIYSECLDRVVQLRDKYAWDVKKSCDLLIYYNRLHIERIFDEEFPDTSDMETEGWRSVSFVKGFRICCFCADDSAPELLKSAQGKLRQKYE
jgi:hypothetical protein